MGNIIRKILAFFGFGKNNKDELLRDTDEQEYDEKKIQRNGIAAEPTLPQEAVAKNGVCRKRMNVLSESGKDASSDRESGDLNGHIKELSPEAAIREKSFDHNFVKHEPIQVKQEQVEENENEEKDVFDAEFVEQNFVKNNEEEPLCNGHDDPCGAGDESIEKPMQLKFQSDGNKVSIAGSFNEWRPELDMIRLDNGKFEANLSLAAGQYEYKFVVDGVWCHDPTQPTIVNEHGTENNVLIVK